MNLPAFFLKLVNMSISASWLVLAVLILRPVMKKAPKWLTCTLWSLVGIRLLVPDSIESIFSLVPSTQTLPPEIITENRFEVNTGIPVINQHINNEVLSGYYEGVTVPVDTGLNMVSEASVIWLMGLILLALYSIISYLLLRRKVSASMHLRDNLYLCDYIESPFILGIFRPRIYLPSALDPANWPHVLAHENAHLKRRDHWWKPLGFALLCIHWFNPLMWLAYVLLCKDIELACDEKVIKELGDQGKAAYSEALLECSMPRYLIAACPLAFGEVAVKDRIRSILNYKKPAFWIILICLILCIAAAVCFLTDPVEEPESVEFIGTVVSTGPFHITVEPEAGSNEAVSADRIDVILPDNAPTIQNGDTVRIEYDGLIREIYPAQIPNVLEIEILNDLKYVSKNYSLSRLILDGYVVMVDGDAVSGQQFLHNFYQKVSKGAPASVRLATYYTIGDPDRMADDLFESSRAHYPSLTVYELSYDGESYTIRWFEGDQEYTETWHYLMHYTGDAGSPFMTFQSYEGYVLTDRNDVTYDELWHGMVSADFNDQIPFRTVFMDYTYENEPTFWDLEEAQSALEPFMVRYGIATLDANELTGRLDIQVYEWVDGLFDLIEQYIDPRFVTVTELRGTIAFTATSYDRIEDAVTDGCVTSINGDLVAGQQYWDDFLKKSASGQVAVVRLANFYTLSSPKNYDPGDFPDIFRRSPTMSVTELIYDGTQYIHRLYSRGRVYTDTYPYLLRYSGVTYGSITYRDIYLLTEHNDLTWDEYIRNTGLSASIYRRGYRLCSDILYENEPDLPALEKAKADLTPYMSEYRITSLTANSMTGRLDVKVSEWVDGLDTLISRYIGLPFVTITHEAGWEHLANQNDLTVRFSQYFDLQYYMGLDVYALEDGYVLFSGTDKDQTEEEIMALPRATAGEMALILETYHADHSMSVIDITVHNRTSRTEYAIRKELGIYPECSVNADFSSVSSTGGTLIFSIFNLDDKEVWAGQEFQLEIMTENGWENFGYDPAELAWDTSLLFHRQGTGMNPMQTYFLTKEEVNVFVQWSAIAKDPLPPGQYRFSKTVCIRDGEETRAHVCYAIFTIS